MNDTVVTILASVLVAIIGSGGMTAIVQHLINKSKDDPVKDGVRLLMQDKIEFLATKYCQEGEITWQAKKYINSAYHTYKALGGNGDIAELMEDLNALKVRY